MVAIKDMKIPSCCGECQMASCKGLSGQFYCDITTYDIDMDDTRRDADCPLIEIVTCKDCKYWYRDGLSAISGNCEKLSHRERNSTLYVEIERKTVETSYCSDGKRRGSEE